MPWAARESIGLAAGVDTIEHGDGLDDEMMDLMIRRGVYWCPTFYVSVYVAQGRSEAGAPVWNDMLALKAKAFAKAVKKGVKISFGTDVGGLPGPKTRRRNSAIWSSTG